MPLFCCSHLKKIGWGFTCSLAGMSSLGRSGRYIHTAETRPTADPTGNRGGCPRKQIPEKTERAAETDRPLGFRLWETAMGNRSRNPMGNRGLVSALCTNAARISGAVFTRVHMARLPSGHGLGSIYGYCKKHRIQRSPNDATTHTCVKYDMQVPSTDA